MINIHKTVQKFALSCFAVLALAGTVSVSSSTSAYACSTCQTFQTALEQEFNTHKNWMDTEWWNQYVEPALKSSATENRNVSMLETVMYGVFLDVQNQLSAQRAIQELTVNSVKNYTPSETICKFGTLSRSLAQSQSKAKANQLILSKRSMNRQLGQAHMSSAEGEDADRTARLTQFQKNYCDEKDFGSGMKSLCAQTAVPDTALNLDINYTRAVDTKPTLDVDFTNATPTTDEKAILALANNLYAHRVFNRINANSLKSGGDTQKTYLDQRAIVAKRGVAENTFNEIVGQKAAGSPGSKAYMVTVLQSLGLNAIDAAKYVTDNPSYDAQMEVLTKKLYQDPAFYANLMDSPANVNRQYAALQSFGLMQKRDIFESVSRSEMLMSLLLEMEIAKYQDDIQNRQNQ